MPVNDFEKQVQQKMDELQLRPSSTVWEEVEKRIRNEKKRRRFIFWFFLFGVLLLGSTGWWLVNGNKKQSFANTRVAQHDIYKKTDSQTSNTHNNVDKVSQPETSNTKSVPTSNDSIIQEANTIMANKRSIDKKSTTPVVKIEIESKAKRVKEKIAVTHLKEEKKEKEVAIDTNVVIKAEPTINTDSIATAKKVVSTEVADKEKVSPNKQNDTLIAQAEEPLSKKDSSKTKKGKWEIGVTILAGNSNKTEGFSFFGGMKSMDANPQYATPGGPLTVINPAPNPASGFAWQLGAYAKRQLTTKTGLSIGIRFSSYSTKQKTGTYVDSSGVFNTRYYSTSFNNVYRNGVVNTYKNRYSYVEIPVAFHWQINKGKKMPLVFQNGISFGLLTGTNGLAYNSGLNLFYQDKKSYNKLQLSYQTGLYAKFLNKTRHPFIVGLLANYHFSKLQKINNYGGNHLSSFGVQLGWLLKK